MYLSGLWPVFVVTYDKYSIEMGFNPFFIYENKSNGCSQNLIRNFYICITFHNNEKNILSISSLYQSD